MTMRCVLLLCGLSLLPLPVDAVAAAAAAGPKVAAAQSLPVPGASPGPRSGPTSREATRLQRLVAVAALWNEIKYFHPALITRRVDWDRALVDALPRIEAARNASEYRSAIDQLLAPLGDPGTRTLDPLAAAGTMHDPARAPAAVAPLVRMDAGVLHVDIARMAEAVDATGSSAGIDGALAPVLEALKTATALVLDARATRPPDADHYTGYLMQELLGKGSNQPLTLGALRYRIHQGYPSQTGSLSSGGYMRGMVTEQPARLPAQGERPWPPTVVLVNVDTAIPVEMLAGLQAAGLAQVLGDGGAIDLGASPRVMDLGEGVRAQVRTTELVAPDGRAGFQVDGTTSTDAGEAVAIAGALAALRSARASGPSDAGLHAVVPATPLLGDVDDAYPDMKFPSREYRLLALFRFWGVIDNFFPYRPLIGPAWNDVIARYVPRFEANRDAADYQLTVRALVAELHDSHGFLRGDFDASAERLGRSAPPVVVDWVQGQTVVTHLFEDGTGLRLGDSVRTVDGRPVAELRDYLGGFIAASTPQAWRRDVHRSLLRGQPDSKVTLGVTGLDGGQREVTLVRSLVRTDPRIVAFMQAKARSQPVYGVLAEGIGYVDLDRLQPDEVDAMFQAIKGTRATIFDMRGYPNGTAWTVAPRLTRRTDVIASLFEAPLVDGRGRGDPALRRGRQSFADPLPKAEGAPYLGKVVMLINEKTQSQAESTGLFFEAATGVTFIGSPSAGADGDITELALPGGLAASFSGHDVRHADGRQLQRVGLLPDVRVEPTIAGLVAGRDEVLEAALAWLAK